jgi:hypothetical protein
MAFKISLRAFRLVAISASVPVFACGGPSSPGGLDGLFGGSPASGGLTGAGGGSSPSGGSAAGGSIAAGGGSGGSSESATGGTGDPPSGGQTSSGGTGPVGGASGGVGGGAPGSGGSTDGAGGSGEASGYPEHTGADCSVMPGEMKKNDPLPDPFAMNDGTRISKKSEWACRRAEIRKDIEKYEVGTKPEPPEVQATLSGATLTVQVTTSSGSITLTSNTSGSGPCVAIGMNGNAANISGCKQIPFMHDQVVTYAQGSGSHNTADPYYKVYPEAAGKIGKYSAWAWGVSRLIDGIIQVQEELGVDPTKIGVQGCSYAGKMALFAGAFDERIALTVAQESGGGGITSWRTSQDFTKRTGTNIEKIDNTNFSWFLGSMKTLDPYSLPHDHHELIAMIAPRAVIALGNTDYEWLGDESGYKSIKAAQEVWKAFGALDRIGYDFTGGHRHCGAATSQQAAVKAFVDKFLKGMDANTDIAVAPTQNGFELDTSSVINWETPTLE